MWDDSILDGGFGDVDNIAVLLLLEHTPPDKRKEVMEVLKIEDPEAFEEFCELHNEELKKLGL
jgi:hypothetical protein